MIITVNLSLGYHTLETPFRAGPIGLGAREPRSVLNIPGCCILMGVAPLWAGLSVNVRTQKRAYARERSGERMWVGQAAKDVAIDGGKC